MNEENATKRTIVYYTKIGQIETYSKIFCDEVDATVFMRKMESPHAARRLIRYDTTHIEEK